MAPSSVKESIDRKRKKQIERITLLPEAPPRIRSRKQSPEQLESWVVEGTPAKPPPPKPQPWQVKRERVSKLFTSHNCTNVKPKGLEPSVGHTTTKPSSSTAQKIIHGKDLHMNKASAPIGDWCCKQEDKSDDNYVEEDLMMVAANGEDIDITHWTPAHFLDLDKSESDWMTAEDCNSDKILQELLPVDSLTFDWTNDPNSFCGQREEFTGKPGPTFSMEETVKPLNIFLKYFDNELLDFLVYETNKYSTYSTGRDFTKYSRLNCWKNTDRGEMTIFLAILIFLGLGPLSEEKDYWRENGFLTLKYFKNLMHYNRFVLLKRVLHMTYGSTNNLTEEETKLQKLLPVLNHLQRKFSTLYLPSRDIVVDESLLNWHGRGQLNFAQKIATKAITVRVKTCELSESATGYLWNFIVYTRKQHNQKADDMTETDNQPSSFQPPLPTNTAARIVCDLIKPLFGKGHTVIMDDLYNSPLLTRYLKAHGTDCFGTLRLNREFVPEAMKKMFKTDVRPSEIIQSYCQDMSLMVMCDTNVVSMISTFHKDQVGGKEKYGRFKFKSQAKLDYNIAMGGVDKKDKLLASGQRTRNKVWLQKVFQRLLNVTVLNSYIIFKTSLGNGSISYRAFRRRLAEELVQTFRSSEMEYPIQVTTVAQSPGPTQRPILSGNHFVGTGHTRFALCVWCRKSRSKYICKQCSVTLCLQVCFEEYHTKT